LSNRIVLRFGEPVNFVLRQQNAKQRRRTSVCHVISLGSASLTTNNSGAAGAAQEYDPWGKVRSGGISQTKCTYTGQYLDETGLLFYNAVTTTLPSAASFLLIPLSPVTPRAAWTASRSSR